MSRHVDLDKILDDALDDFEEQDLAAKAGILAEGHDSGNLDADDQLSTKRMQMLKMMEDMENQESGDAVRVALRDLSQTKAGNDTVEDLFANLSNQFDTSFKPSFVPDNLNDQGNDVAGADRTVAATLKMLAESQKGMEGFEAGRIEGVGETMMEEMMQQFQALGDREDYNEVIDGVMRQLLSKKLMYIPIQQICAKFPEWLAFHKDSLRDSEYTNYGKMYQTFQKILAVYDVEPDNFPRLMELMFDMQQYGQPPAEIIKDLAPGLKFDENGMPIMPNMGPGMVPGGEGFPGMTDVSGQMAEGQCLIM